MLGWATLGGARALGLESEIGSIVEGKAADLVLLRSEAMPPAEPVAQTVLQSSVRDVEAVMVAGELVKRDGRLTSDAAERAGRLAAESRERIFAARAGARRAAPAGARGIPGDDDRRDAPQPGRRARHGGMNRCR